MGGGTHSLTCVNCSYTTSIRTHGRKPEVLSYQPTPQSAQGRCKHEGALLPWPLPGLLLSWLFSTQVVGLYCITREFTPGVHVHARSLLRLLASSPACPGMHTISGANPDHDQILLRTAADDAKLTDTTRCADTVNHWRAPALKGAILTMTERAAAHLTRGGCPNIHRTVPT